MRFKLFNGLILGVCLVIIYSLFVIKDKVSHLRYRLDEVKRQTAREKNSIHVLKAEFAYLSSPERLKKLADNYLELQAIKTSQLIRDPLLNKGESLMVSVELTKPQKNPAKRKIKWRYKKGPDKYIQTVSSKGISK